MDYIKEYVFVNEMIRALKGEKGGKILFDQVIKDEIQGTRSLRRKGMLLSL
jgi:hypothetical protein